ncbi:MAG TPA: hypothetical protein VG406_20110 [Isosphaeraceae bacterium]|jgi:hypothetical protein|nr:hypothetical protein [Isosphaeraceae bacterium]
MGKSIVEELSGEGGRDPDARKNRRKVIFACLGILLAAILLAFFDQGVSGNEQESSELVGHPGEEPPNDELEFMIQYLESEHGPRPEDKYPGLTPERYFEMKKADFALAQLMRKRYGKENYAPRSYARTQKLLQDLQKQYNLTPNGKRK